MNVFLDTSAVVKIYIDEAYSQMVRNLYSAADNTIYIADIAKVEFWSAVKKRFDQADIEKQQYSLITTYFLNDFRDSFKVVKSEEHLLDQALELIGEYSLRAYDSVQLAAALQCQESLSDRLVFVSFDKKLTNTAEKSGLKIFRIPKAEEISPERALKSIIFDHTTKYYKEAHKPVQQKRFIPGQSRLPYAGRVYDEKEMLNLVDSALDFWLTAGRFEREFTAKLGGFLGAKHVITTNSGSSANLLAITALTSHKLGDRQLKPGDEVITVAAAFPTTVAPIIQNGLVPVFVDIELGSYNVNVQQLEAAISKRTKAIFLAHTMGFPFDLDQVLEIARRQNLWLIEDNCDALGAKWDGKYTGTIGHLGTQSFYPAHHITMGEGGAVITDDTQLKQLVTSFRDWGRDCWCDPGKDNTCGKRFERQLGTLPFGYDHKYVYSHLGYNLKITDMQAAVGLAQLDKLPAFIEKRQENWQRLYQGLKELEEFFILPVISPQAEASPFGFVLTIRDGAPFNRQQITNFLEAGKIQTRTVFAGNILRQPAFTESAASYRIAGELKNTDKVMTDTFWIGVYPGLSEKMLEYILECFYRLPKELKCVAW